MGQPSCLDEIWRPRIHSKAGTIWNFKETRKDLNRQKQKMTLKFATSDFIYRYHVDSGVQLYMPERRNIPLNYIDVTRMTHTNLDLLRESRVDDHWNVDVDRNLEVHIIKLKPPKDIYGQGNHQTSLIVT